MSPIGDAVVQEGWQRPVSAVRRKVRSTIRTLRLYRILLGAALRGQAQYRGSLWMMLAGGMAYQAAGIALIWIVLDRFGQIGGWTLAEVALLYGMRLTAHGVWLLLLNQLSTIDEVVREGVFDRFLVRPLNPLVQLATRRFHLTSLGDLAGGAILLTVAATMVSVDWSPLAIGYLLLAIAGGAMVEMALYIAASALSFRLLSTTGLRFIIDELFAIFGGYPFKIYPSAARFAMTFLLPLAFVAYFPATVLLDRTDELSVLPAIASLAPLIGVILLTAAYLFWRRQTRYYSSSGH